MNLKYLCCTLSVLICSASADRDFDRRFQLLIKRAMPTLSAELASSSAIIFPITSQPLFKRAMPTLTVSSNTSSLNTSSTSSTSSASLSSYSATFTPSVPHTAGNKHIYRTSYPTGTVFVIVGAIIGFLGVLFSIIWLLFAIRGWLSARREYRSQSIQARYQADPFMFQSGDADSEYSDGSTHSDVSESVLKARSSKRPELRTLGSQSTIDLLQGGTLPAGMISHAERNSMFISPTEIMKNTANAKSLSSNDTPQSAFSEFMAPVRNTHILEHSDPLYQVAYGEPRAVRPPSINLEKMFDEDL
ncbi:LAME_0D10330g1_1 [Lachancea meyersii CBS 8951]|uniref:LAME_0D10330g1_1 n=1 Tax=Lachancea meyersii CBS 8951 TaxID=1266667 RepID=A0A1G4JC96_9SACH|nr:LAME_0D10330g1_1 [Lachancea meyersii CBS 8951]